MRLALALCAITLLCQTALPAGAENTDENAPVLGAKVGVKSGGECGAGKLQLSDQQKEKVFELKNKLLSDIGPKKLALSQETRKLKDLLTQENIDRKAIQDSQDKINSLRTDLANVQIAFKMDFQEQLTPEQRKMTRYRGMKGGKGHHGKGRMHKRFQRSQEDHVSPEAVSENAEVFQPANI